MTQRRTLLGLSLLSAGSLAVGGLGIFEAWRYRNAAIDTQARKEAAIRALEARTAVTDQVQGRAIISQFTSLVASDDPRKIAYQLTDVLYQNNSGWDRDDQFPTPALGFVMTVTGHASNLCSGLSRNLHWALTCFSIPNRLVIFAAKSFLDGRRLGDTHELVEAEIDGKVIVLDPTFSVTYCNGDDPAPIDARTMVACAKAGTLRAQQIGPSRPGRSPADYYLPIQQLAVAMQATGGGADFYQQEIPHPGWFPQTMARYRAT